MFESYYSLLAQQLISWAKGEKDHSKAVKLLRIANRVEKRYRDRYIDNATDMSQWIHCMYECNYYEIQP